MSAQVRRPDLPLDSLSGVSQGNLVQQVTSIFISYYGTYTIDAAASTEWLGVEEWLGVSESYRHPTFGLLI